MRENSEPVLVNSIGVDRTRASTENNIIEVEVEFEDAFRIRSSRDLSLSNPMNLTNQRRRL